jgi:replicative DNA helicase
MSNPAQFPKREQGGKPALSIASAIDVQVPVSEEAEQAFLGAVMIGGAGVLISALAQVGLRADDFYFLKHRMVFEAMVKLSAEQQPFDVVTLGERLRADGKLDAVGGAAELIRLMNSTPSSMHAGFYASIISTTGVRRQLLRFADAVKALAKDEVQDTQAVMAKIETEYADIQARQTKGRVTSIETNVNRVLDHLDAEGDMVIPLGADIGLDEMLGGGLMFGHLYLVYARSEHGKTAFMMNAAYQAAMRGFRVACFVTETHPDDFTRGLMAMHAGVHPLGMLRRNVTNDDMRRIMEASSAVAKLPIHLVNATDRTPEDVYRYCQTLQESGGLDVVFFDYLQGIHVPRDMFKGNRYDELNYAIGRFEVMCRPPHLNVAFVLLAQANARAVGDERPTLQTVEGTGRAEQKADVGIALYRIGKVKPDAPNPTEFEMIVQKNRVTGRSGTVVRRMNAKTRKIERPERNT